MRIESYFSLHQLNYFDPLSPGIKNAFPCKCQPYTPKDAHPPAMPCYAKLKRILIKVRDS